MTTTDRRPDIRVSPDAPDADHAKEHASRNWLIFERDEPTDEAITTATGPAVKMARGRGYKDARNPLLGYSCLGAVKALNEEAAVQAVARATRRLGAYAVIPAVFIDFTRPAEDVESETLQLNP